MDYLFHDPRPDLPDTLIWQKLLKFQKTYSLQACLWTIRSAGAVIKPSRNGLKISYQPNSDWADEQEFNELNHIHLKPFAVDIKRLFIRLESEVPYGNKKNLTTSHKPEEQYLSRTGRTRLHVGYRRSTGV